MVCPSKSLLIKLNADNRHAFVIQNFWCSPQEKLGKCTRVCSNCQIALHEAFENARSVENPQNFLSILTWAMREKVAEIAEQGERPHALPRTWLGEIDQRNPFEILGEVLHLP